MLTSITPLGERSRGSRWGLTVGAYFAGSVVAGGSLGLGLGALGDLLLTASGAGAELRLSVLAAGLAAGLALDLGLWGLHLPSVRRQVNEDWLRAFRGWVYGLAFGLQLGAGVATIVSASAVYLTFLAALLSGSAALGAAIGACFGALRAATLLGAARVHDPRGLVALGDRLRRWRRPAARGAMLLQGALLLSASAALL